MPFIKRTSTKMPQSQVAAKKNFVGRENELQFFVEKILNPEDPEYNIISISGEGGVGKSTLIARFIDEISSFHYKDYCLYALVDEQQTTPHNIMEKFANQLSEAGTPLIEFDRALTNYKEAIRKLQIERETAQDNAIRETVSLIGTVAEEVPVVGGVLHKGADIVTELYLKERRARQLLKNAELLEDPITDLTKMFVEELNHLTDKQIALGPSKTKRSLRVILFFDTFEQLGNEVAPWLLDHFLQASISTNVVLVIAGRDSIENSTSNDPKRWLPYRDNSIIYLINLNSFTEEETRVYLAERGINDSLYIHTIWQLSKGLPLYLSLLTFNPQEEIDPTAGVVANFLRWIPEHEQIKRRLALDAALFSRPFNQDDLAAFTHLQEHEQIALYDWLVRLPFVRSSPHDGRHRYHDLAQEMFRRHLYQRSQKEYYSTRYVLADYYNSLLKKIRKQETIKDYCSSEYLELTLALIYQLYYLPDEIGYIDSIEYILNVYRVTNSEQDKEIIRFLRDLPNEQKNNKLSNHGLPIAELLLHFIEALNEDQQQQLLETSTALIKKTALKPLFSSELLAWLYRKRGDVNETFKEYMLAIADYTYAIELNSNNDVAYNDRGNAYRKLGNYEMAIADYTHAIELDPNYDSYYFNRGHIYEKLENYEMAIADYTHAIELDPNYDSYYFNRGHIYEKLENYEMAIADYTHAIELDPDDQFTYIKRAYTYEKLENYEMAIADYTHAIELDPQRISTYCDRGNTYKRINKYEQAIFDYNFAIELDPNYVYAYCNRGRTYIDLKAYEQAIADFNLVTELDPKHGDAFSKRGYVYTQLKEYERAIADFDRAIELDPRQTDAYLERGKFYTQLKEYERAIADFDRAIELDPNLAAAYHDRGQVYTNVEKFQLAIRDFERAFALDAKYICMYNHCGLLFSYLGKYAEAVDNYVQDLQQNPGNYTALYNIAVAMVRWKGFSNSQTHINTARIALQSTTDPETNGSVLYGLGGLYALAGDTTNALKYLEQALSYEGETASWARHDIAWLDLYLNSQFQALVSEA